MTANFTLLIIPAVILVAPIVLTIASKQQKSSKQKLRIVFQISLTIILALSFLNWETQSPGGRNAFMLATSFQNIFLWLFLTITFLGIILLSFKKYLFDLLATVASVISTFLFFAAAITISNAIGRSIVSPALITSAMIVLINNVLGLALVNRDSNLLAKYPFSQEAVKYAQKHKIKQTKFQILLTWVAFGAVIAFMAIMLKSTL